MSAEGNGLTIRGAGLRCDVETRCLDLGSPQQLDIFSGRHLVTASALLDLVSEAWLRGVAERCRANGAAALFALSYTGMSRCTPVEPEDDVVLDLFNRHQARDKGLGGPAAGPAAVNAAERCFTAVGYRVRRQESDWTLLPEQRDLQRQLIEGWARAAAEVAPDTTVMIDGWLTRRLGHLDDGRSRVTVSHEDFAAWL